MTISAIVITPSQSMSHGLTRSGGEPNEKYEFLKYSMSATVTSMLPSTSPQILSLRKFVTKASLEAVGLSV
jgi:hypothetical protein